MVLSLVDGTAVRVFPNADGTYSIPIPARIYHMSRMPKVMFLAVVTRPRPEYDFDGKIGMWPFTVERLAKRSDQRTGTVAGVSVIIETRRSTPRLISRRSLARASSRRSRTKMAW